jgi:hypothetical protein
MRGERRTEILTNQWFAVDSLSDSSTLFVNQINALLAIIQVDSKGWLPEFK